MKKKKKSRLSAFRDSNSSSSSSSSSCSDESSSGSNRSARTERKKLMQSVENKQKLDCKKPGASEQQLIVTVGGGDAGPESYAPDSWKKKLGEQVTPSSNPVMGHQLVEYQLPSPAQELPEEVNVAGAGAADVQSELQGPQTTKCNTANGEAQDAVETVSPVEKAVSSADNSSSSRSSSYEEVEEEDDKAKRESCGLSSEVLDTTNESVEMEEEHIRDHANSNGRDHVVDDVCSKSSEIAQISPKVDENGESGGSSTTSSSGNGTVEAATAETIDQTDVATKYRNGDSDIGTKEGIGVAPETNGTDHRKEGEDVNELLRNVPSDEAEKDSTSREETKDTTSSSTHIGDYLVAPAEDPIAGSCMEEDVIAVKHHDLQMRGPSSTTVGYTVSTTVETFTNSVTYSKEDGFAGFEEENTSSSSSSKKKAPYFEDHHNDNNDKSMASSSLNSAEGESEVQRVLRLQTTHDLLCPVCGSCITKRVILRKRKRTSPSVVSVEKWVLLNEEEIQSQDALEELHTSPTTTAAAVKEEVTVVEPAADAADDGHGYEYEEDWGCLACFTLFFRRVWQRAEEIPRASSSSAAEIPRSSSSSAAETQEPPEDYHPPGLPQVEAETIVGVESAESVEVLSPVVEEDGSEHYYKNKCLPLLFPWRQIATTKLSHHPELLTPLLGEKEEEKTSIAAKDVVQMSIPTQSSRELLIGTLNKAPEQPNVEQPQKVTTAAAAHAKDDDINCFSLFLPPFPWGETQQTAQSNRPEAVVAVADEQPALRSNKEVQAIESDSIIIGSLNVPLTSPTVTPTTLCGEISAAEPPVDVLLPPAATNVCDEAGGQRQIEESPRKASVNCLDLFLPAYPWEEASETTSLLEKTTAAAKQASAEKEINIQESLAWSTATTVSEDLLDPNVVFPAVNSTIKEVILPGVVRTPPEPHTKPAPENLVLSSSTQGIEDDEGKGMDKDAEHPTKKAGIKFSDVFHDPIYVTKIEDKITSAKVVNDQASKAGFNCLPLLLPPYPWEGATQVPVSQGGLVPNLVQEKVVTHVSTSVQDEKALGTKLSWEEEQLDSKCLPLKLPTLAWRGGGRSGTMTSSLAREEARLQSDVKDDELVEEEERPLVRKPPRIHEEKREVVAATTIESPKPVEQQEKAEAIGVEDTTPSSGGDTLAAASVGEEEHQEIKEEASDQDLLPDEEIEAPDTAPPAAVVEEIEEHQPPQLVLPVEKLESVTAKKETIEAKESEDCSCGLLPALLFPAYPWEPSSRDFQTETREERKIKWPAVADRGIATHEVVSRDTHIESRITTTTTTYTKSADPTDEEHDTVDAIKVDTSVSYMDRSIQQQDDQPMQGTLVLDDGSPTIVDEPKTLHHFPPIYKFLDWDTPKKHHPLATTHLPHELQASPPAPTYHWKDEAQQQPQEITEEEEVGVVSEVSRDLAETLQQAPPNAIKEQLNKSSFCECLPIAPSYSIFFRTATEDDQQLKEPLISAEAKSDTDSHDSSVHVSLHQIHRHEEVKLPISQMPDGHSIFSDDHEPASCSCLPPFLFSRVSIGGSTLSHKDGLQQPLLDKRKADTANTDSPTTHVSSSIPDVSDETTTSVIITTDESVIEVYGSDAPSTIEAVTAAAEDLGMMTLTPTVSKVQEYLKSVVYGGLDVSLISLGVVASAAGGDAKTRTVLAMGLANLIFGSISFFHKVIELHKESPMRFRETVGHSFLLNGCLAFLSFLVFGSLPTLTFGFSFRQSNNHDYKMLVTVVVSVISVVLLGCAKVFAKVTQQSYFATLSALIMTGVVAAVAGFYTGEYFSKLLAQFGFDT